MKYIYEIVKCDDNIPARILMQEKPGWRCNTRPHWHKELEFVYMIDGEMHTLTSGKRQVIRNGELFFCNSKEMHVTSVEHSQAQYKYLVVQLSYDFIKHYVSDKESCYFSLADEEAVELLTEQFRKLLLLVESGQGTKEQKYDVIKKTQIVLEIYHILLTRCQVEKVHETDDVPIKTAYAKQVIEYINQHYTEELTLDILAKEVGLSSQYLSKNFKSTTSMGVLQYINLVRLEHANYDLLNGRGNVTEAAVNNGFAGARTYIETCKKVYGMTPTVLQKEYAK